MAIAPETLLFILKVQDQGSASLSNMSIGWTGLGLAITAALGSATQAAVNFDRELTQMQTLSSVTAAQVGMVSDAIKKISIDDARPPQEVADAFRFVTSSGFDAAEAIKIVDAASKGAAIGLGQTKDVADLATTVLNVYGHDSMTAADAVGILAEAVKNGKGETDEMAKSLGRTLPIAAAMGVQFKDVAAAVSAMTINGLSASEATTAIRQTLTAVYAPTMQARKVLKSLGVDYHDLQKTFKEEGFLEGIEKLKEVTKTPVNFRMVVNDKEAVNADLGLIGQNAKNVRNIFKDVDTASEHTLTELFKMASQSDNFKFDQGVVLLKVALLDLGEIVLPMVVSAITALQSAWKFFQDNPAATAAAIVILAGVLMVTLVPALATATGFVIGFTVALLANPFTWLVLALAGLVAAIEHFGDKTYEVNGQVVSGWDVLKAAFVATVAALKAGADQMVTNFKIAFKAVADNAEGLGKVLLAVASRNPAAIAAAVADEINTFNNTSTAGMKNAGDAAAEAYNKAFDDSITVSGNHRKWEESLAKQRAAIEKLGGGKKTGYEPPADTPTTGDYMPSHGAHKAPKTDAEKEAEKVSKLVQEINLQTKAYSESADQKEYLESLRKVGIDTDTVEQKTIEQGLAITEKQAAGNQRLAEIRKIAIAESQKFAAAIVEQNRQSDVQVGAYNQLAQAALLDARSRAIETAGINAQTEALKQHKSAEETAAAVRNARAQAAAKFDSDASISNIDASNAIDDNIAKLKLQQDALGMTARQAAIYTAQEEYRIDQLRKGFPIDDEYIKKLGDQAAAQYDLQHAQLTVQQGMAKFMTDLQENAVSTGQIVYQALGTSLGDTLNVIDQLITGQKVAWRDAVADISGSIAKLIAQMLLYKAVMAGLKFLGFSTGGSTVNSYGLAGDNLYADGAAFFAAGGDFTNQIVNAATAFQYQQNGKQKLGVMGEAGPEAIMPLIQAGNAMAIAAWAKDGTMKALPLQRGPDGSLGVAIDSVHALGESFSRPIVPLSKTPGYGGSSSGGVTVLEGDTHIHAPVQVSYESSGDPKLDEKNIMMMRKVIGQVVDDRVGKALERVGRNGGRSNMFGLNGRS